MVRGFRGFVAGAIAVVALLCGAGAADAGAPSEVVALKVGKSATGPFGAHVRVNIPSDESRNVYLKAKSISGEPEGAALIDNFVTTEVTRRYFTQNGLEITSSVLGDGYPFLAKPKGRVFRLRIKRMNDPAEICWTIILVDEVAGNEERVTINVNQPNSACD